MRSSPRLSSNVCQHLGEAGPAQRGLELLDELGEGPDVGPVVDHDDDRARIGWPHTRAARPADIEWPTTTGRSTASEPTSWCTCAATSSSGAGTPAAVAVAGRSIAMLRTLPSRRSMIGRQVRRSKVRPCRRTTRRTGALVVVGEARSPSLLPLSSLPPRSTIAFRNGVTVTMLRYAVEQWADAESTTTTTAAALLDAAERTIAEGGVDALSLREVATSAGTTTRAIYSLFGSKDGLVGALGVRAFNLLQREVEALPATDSARERPCRSGAHLPTLRRSSTPRCSRSRCTVPIRPSGPASMPPPPTRS